VLTPNVGVGGSVGEATGSGLEGVEVARVGIGVLLAVGKGLVVGMVGSRTSKVSSAALSTGMTTSLRAQAKPEKTKAITARDNFTLGLLQNTMYEPHRDI
jgi:hypothetical protein